MTYDFNSSDTLLNDVPNPYKFENSFMFITAAVTMAGAVHVILTAKHLFQIHDDKLAAVTLSLAMILGGVSMNTLIKALSQVRFYLGRRFPLGLVGELPVTETGVGVGTEDLLETMRHRAIHFP
jgi:undecaprenyl pyrophosphate phosphatase UppP